MEDDVKKKSVHKCITGSVCCTAEIEHCKSTITKKIFNKMQKGFKATCGKK